MRCRHGSQLGRGTLRPTAPGPCTAMKESGMKRLLIASVALALLAPAGAAVAQSPGPLISEAICVEIHVAPNAGPQGDPARYPDALTWLGLAIPANALATATVVACPGAGPAPSGAPAAPASGESCAI